MQTISLSPDNIQRLVNIAFTLEAISDKKGCTTRYEDIPGKPLEDFLISGINSSVYFRKLVVDIESGKNSGIFKYFKEALENSNYNKSHKTVNFGLLQIMFPCVYARLFCNDKKIIIDKLIDIVKMENVEDIKNLIEARDFSLESSKNNYKKEFFKKEKIKLLKAKSPYELYMISMNIPGKEESGYQWCDQFKNGLPILRNFFGYFESNDEPILVKIKKSYEIISNDNPNIKKGIIADMCAAAIFLHLSFK